MHQFGIKLFQFLFVKLRLGMADFFKVQRLGQLLKRIKRFDCFRCAEFGQKGTNSHSFNSLFAQLPNAKAAKAFRKFSFLSCQKRQMGKSRYFSADCLEHLYLRSCIRNMVFTADNVCNGKVNIVNN